MIFSRLGRAAATLGEFLDLLLTLRPSRKGSAKIFGLPAHTGGPRTKAAQLALACVRRGEGYSRIICLSSVRVPIALLRILRALGAEIVVNQNGVYYPLWCPADYERRNGFLRSLNAVAHHSYFQSEFSEQSYQYWVGELPRSRSLLFNAVDRSVFSPGGEPGARARIVVFLDFRDTTRGLWDYFLSLAGRASDVDWVFMGAASDAWLCDYVRNAGGAELHFGPAQDEVARVLRSCDFALHFVYNDVCPNKVLECLASGVFVLCSSAGGAKELVAGGGGRVIPVREGYDRVEYPDPEQTLALIRDLVPKRRELKAEACVAAARFDLAPWLAVMTGKMTKSADPVTPEAGR